MAAFGCEDDVLLVHDQGGELSATKMENPAGAAEGARVGTLAAHEGALALVGNFGDALVWIVPDEETMAVVDTEAAPLRFTFNHEGEQLLALTEDGLLHRLGADSGEVHGSVQVLDAVATTARHGSYVAPGLTVAEGAVYVSVPAEGQIADIQLDDLSVARRLDVAGTPGGLAVLFLEGGTVH